MSLSQRTIRPTRWTAGRRTWNHRRPALLAAAAISAVALTPASAVAAPAADPILPQPGQVTLFTGRNQTGFPQVVRYSNCGFAAAVNRPIGSFVNLPLPGCEVVLLSAAGSFELCEGAGNVPTVVPPAARLVTRPGSSPRCPVV